MIKASECSYGCCIWTSLDVWLENISKFLFLNALKVHFLRPWDCSTSTKIHSLVWQTNGRLHKLLAKLKLGIIKKGKINVIWYYVYVYILVGKALEIGGDDVDFPLILLTWDGVKKNGLKFIAECIYGEVIRLGRCVRSFVIN